MLTQNFPLIQILFLFICCFFMPFLKKDFHVKIFSLVSLIIVMLLSLVTLKHVATSGSFFYSAGYSGSIWGIQFFVGNIESILVSWFLFVACCIVWFSFSTIDEEITPNRLRLFYILINLLMGSIIGIIYTNDIFNGYVFIEVAALASCGIVIIKDKIENMKAALKYLIMSTIGSGLILMGIAFLYSFTGHLNIDLIHAEFLKGYGNYSNSLLIVFALFTAGLGVKSAMFPLHSWLPDAHSSAPTASSAMLSAIVLKGFAYFLIKFIYRIIGIEIASQFNILLVILILGSCGMIFGSIMAILQKNIKRLVAYSSIAQMGYIFFAIGLGSEFGATIAVYHMMGHAVTKSALFMCAGLMIKKTGHKELSFYKGLGIEMPIVFTLFTLGSLSMVGIPILPGFISKWYLAIESINLGMVGLIFIVLASSLLNAVYYFPIVINAFFGTDNLQGREYKSKMGTKGQVLPISALILAMILLGAFSKQIIDFISKGVYI